MPVSRRKLLFWLITSLPGLLLLILVSVVAYDLYALNRVDPAVMLADIEEDLTDRVFTVFPFPEKIRHIDESRTTVFIFGASTLRFSNGLVFPDYLEALDPDLQVINLGENGIDSSSVLYRVWQALDIAKPDVIVLLFGHNDYNYAYQGYLLKKYFNKLDWLLRIPFLFGYRNGPVGQFEIIDFSWYARLHRPKLFNFFQRLGWLKIKGQEYAPINQVVLNSFKKNLGNILGLAAAKDIPVVLMTPIGNLQAEPFGEERITTALYRKGMASSDYEQALRYLKMARDSEIFTYDIRAKSQLLEFIRSIREPGVHILDLERKLEELRFDFGPGGFTDYFHYDDRTHRAVAEIIYDYLEAEQLIVRRQVDVKP